MYKIHCIKCKKVISKNLHEANHGYCDRCIPKIQSFTISHDFDSYSNILNINLRDLECKHIMYIDESCRKVYKDGVEACFYNIQWGYFRENVSKDSENYTIEQMIADNFLKPIRITVTQNRVWADNTHTTISYIRRYGDETKVKDVPFYICDLRKVPVTILGDKKNIWFNEECMSNAIRNSLRIKYLEENGGRTHRWTISDLMKQLIG
ncbi:hypothetical protein MKA27_17600 [[Clostridium] innocuum]|uniref:hypothetical protein n=1 Tax=Clostridium innocuum TaxID=1522 RepID=UPI000D6BB21F|nr:hypothetical protein [[Clostridium] innocuum]MCR0316339.1 hypothetical protein [[Clostridium] innocuum]MCR0375612.1 hypothetical protein [[Clostridium] innocuum]MCR0603684.1 hypothetical protein [[Clostridium] innocuum]PWJ12033.1 hypothetical protein ATF84_11575 [[Clostridium] innocuum]SSA47634.1 hypothetical protein SAMN04487929_11575 [[Clostridium] innocuum]